jgi:hypothetical protein
MIRNIDLIFKRTVSYQYIDRWITVQWDGSQELDEAGNTFSTLLCGVEEKKGEIEG